MNSKILSLGAALLAVLALAGCSHECTHDSDCATKGTGYVCYLSSCQLKAQPLVPDAGPTCSPACSGDTAVCDTSGQTPTCVQCDSANASACSGSTPVCGPTDTCVTCAQNSDCKDPSAPVCDTSVAGGACVACTSGNDTACTSQGKICDGAAKQCITCAGNGDCHDPNAPVCDTSVAGGACVACDSADTAQCGGGTPFCNLTTNGSEQPDTCVVCRTNTDCGGLTCDTSVPGGACRCTNSTECLNSTPATPNCDTGTSTCVVCDSNTPGTGVTCASTPTTPACNTAVPGGQCVQCTSDNTTACLAAGPTPMCDTQASSPTANSCVGCVNGGSCTYAQDCVGTDGGSYSPDRTCQAVDVNAADTQITAVRGAFLADGGAQALGAPMTMNNGLVTYVHPAIGGDLGGFFVQAKPTVTPAPNTAGAIFVIADGGVVNVGDRVQLQVTAIAATSGQVKEVSGVSGLTVVNSGHSVAPLTADVSGVDLAVAANSASYESALLNVSGALFSADGGIPTSGSGFNQLILNDTGNSTNPTNQVFRFSAASQLANDVEGGCNVNATQIPGWRFKGTAEPTAYAASDFVVSGCPGPRMVGATDSDVDTLQISFDRSLNPASVNAAAISFPFDDCSISPQPAGCISVQSVSVTGRVITVHTSAQTRGQIYTVQVALTVTDKAGTAVQPNDPAGSPTRARLSFTGNQYPPELVINEVNANLTSDGTGGGTPHDLVEIKVLKGGYTGGLSLQMNFKGYTSPNNSVDPVCNFPNAYVATGDLIVVHLNPSTGNGDAAASETTSKSEQPASSNPANYDNAWDFEGLTTPSFDTDLVVTNDEVLSIYSASTNSLLDAVPFVANTDGSGGFESNFQSWLSSIEGQGFWLPATCASGCTSATAESSSVLWQSASLGNAKTGPSLQRVSGSSNQGHSSSDWTVKTATWGADN
jgi:hypothetical protein